ncbi:unnamed protein product [Didymodactylos carnosus]|uniref:Mab-21-like HhH/H2TH-like domain-containing protein n=1 Tax=Didymodactylos carnosus TaxID=1234261 RepID=A0A815MFP9_9BILA|nr:unnamed protein product [Didymodactylos carnosus]CAF1423962.1 unnamed protein product [Didymodactylos carnosus]CAF3987686.1 unnamed protein product [Didymodactylos carnosus]CAF4305572.1 unnamed protein product [Didymodactylos carnosus]
MDILTVSPFIGSKLAELRSQEEKILNGIARSIYYKYFRQNEIHIKSYVIKTIVLWMCEEYNSDGIFSNVQDEQQVAIELIKYFIDYTKGKLKSRVCKHYFIDAFNQLDEYTEHVVKNSYDILTNDVYVPSMQHEPETTELKPRKFLDLFKEPYSETVEAFRSMETNAANFDKFTYVYRKGIFIIKGNVLEFVGK